MYMMLHNEWLISILSIVYELGTCSRIPISQLTTQRVHAAHSIALGHTDTILQIHSARKNLLKGHLCNHYRALGRTVDLFTMKARLGSDLEMLLVLSEASFFDQVKS